MASTLELTRLGEEKLVDDNVVRVNLVFGEFLDETLGLVERQELGDADTDKGGELLRGEVSADWRAAEETSATALRTGSLNWVLTSVMISRIWSSLANMSSWGAAPPPNMDDIWKHVSCVAMRRTAFSVLAHLLEHGAEAARELAQLAEGLLKDRGEREETQRVARGRSVKDNDGKLHRLDVPKDKCQCQCQCSSTRPVSTHFMTSAKPMASSTPGMANARSCIMPPMPPPDVSAAKPSVPSTTLGSLALTRLDHLLERRVGVNLHGVEVVKAIDLCGVLAKLLRERVGQVVCGVGRLLESADGRVHTSPSPRKRTIRRTDSRTAASWTASEHEVVVLPTPPLPPGASQPGSQWVVETRG